MKRAKGLAMSQASLGSSSGLVEPRLTPSVMLLARFKLCLDGSLPVLVA